MLLILIFAVFLLSDVPFLPELESFRELSRRGDDITAAVFALAYALLTTAGAIDRLREVVWPPGARSKFETDYGMVVLGRRLEELSRQIAAATGQLARITRIETVPKPK